MFIREELIDLMEMFKLASGLTKRNIEFTFRSFLGGAQIICEGWDAICHSGSYGHKEGLIEVMGLPQCNGDVIGYLTAEEVLQMVDTNQLKDLP